LLALSLEVLLNLALSPIAPTLQPHYLSLRDLALSESWHVSVVFQAASLVCALHLQMDPQLRELYSRFTAAGVNYLLF
jgi:hypothetical protein